MECRPGCGACCLAVSISSPIPGMPSGKRAGEVCIHLADDKRCRLFGLPERPAICSVFQADPACCGTNPAEAMELLSALEKSTAPGTSRRK